jgi:hypothetical protein
VGPKTKAASQNPTGYRTRPSRGAGTICLRSRSRSLSMKATSQAESPTAPQLSARPQHAVRQASRSFSDHLKVIPEYAARTKPLRRRTLRCAITLGMSAGVAYEAQGGSCDPFAQDNAGGTPGRSYSDGTIRHHLRAPRSSPDISEGPRPAWSRVSVHLSTPPAGVGKRVNHIATLRLFFVRTLERPEFRDCLP